MNGTKEKILSLITKEKQTKNKIITQFKEKYKIYLSSYRVQILLEELESEKKIKQEEAGWRTYWRLL